MRIKLFCGALCFLVAMATHAQGAVGRSMLPMLDFDRIHVVLIERCTVAAPASVPPLIDAIEAWRKEHYVPQRLLQAYAQADLASRPGAGSVDQSKQVIKLIQDESVAKFSRESAAWSTEKTQKYCQEYPQNLQTPEMNFLKLQQERKAQIDAAPTRGAPDKAPPTQ